MKETVKGMLLALVGPSGCGKGTLGKLLLDAYPEFGFSVSATTRAPRPGEVDGLHYHFMTDAQYDELLAEDAFLEHAEVHGHRYGTLKREVSERIEAGRSVLLDIDQQGAQQVMASDPECVSVFILPPSMAVLRSRLEGRGTEAPEEVERRMRNAVGEIALMHRFRYIIVNDDLDSAMAALRTIVEAEKHRAIRYFPEMTE